MVCLAQALLLRVQVLQQVLSALDWPERQYSERKLRVNREKLAEGFS